MAGRSAGLGTSSACLPMSSRVGHAWWCPHPEVVVVGARVDAVQAVACCLALLVTGCSGADSGEGRRASSSSSLASTVTAPDGVRVDPGIGEAVEQYFARSYTRGL